MCQFGSYLFVAPSLKRCYPNVCYSHRKFMNKTHQIHVPPQRKVTRLNFAIECIIFNVQEKNSPTANESFDRESPGNTTYGFAGTDRKWMIFCITLFYRRYSIT